MIESGRMRSGKELSRREDIGSSVGRERDWLIAPEPVYFYLLPTMYISSLARLAKYTYIVMSSA